MQVSEKVLDKCYADMAQNFKEEIDRNFDYYLKKAFTPDNDFDPDGEWDTSVSLAYFGEFHNFQWIIIGEVNAEMQDQGYENFDIRESEVYYEVMDHIMLYDFPQITKGLYTITGMTSNDCDWFLIIEKAEYLNHE